MSLIKNKALWLVAFAVAAMLFTAIGSSNNVSAGIEDGDTATSSIGTQRVWVLQSFSDDVTCADAEGAILVGDIAGTSAITTADVVTVQIDEDEGDDFLGGVWVCVELDNDGDADNSDFDVVDFDSNDYGSWTDALCAGEDGDETFDSNDDCEDTSGLGTDQLQVICSDTTTDSDCSDDDGDNEGDVAAFFDCGSTAARTTITLQHDSDEDQSDSDYGDGPDEVMFTIFCQGEPDTVTVTASPTTVEIVPAIGSAAHSKITVTISSGGLPVDESTEVDFSVPKCAIEIGNNDPDSTPLVDSTDDGESTATTSDDETNVSDNAAGTASTLVAWFHADWNACTPGDVVVTITIEVDDGADIVRTVTIKVVGPPAFITATAAPDRLICGEKSTITVTVKDALQQNVSDNTPVELISNWGSVIAGTGATLGFPGTGPVNPLASSAAATYNGVAIAYLLTSNNHVGAYEVVAAAGGTLGFHTQDEPGGFHHDGDAYYEEDGVSPTVHESDWSLFRGAPITTQVTVTCTLPAAPVAPTSPQVTSPVTGTGSITPPNTGDAGLASSSSNAMLIVLVGAAAFVLAGIASVSYARR